MSGNQNSISMLYFLRFSMIKNRKRNPDEWSWYTQLTVVEMNDVDMTQKGQGQGQGQGQA